MPNAKAPEWSRRTGTRLSRGGGDQPTRTPAEAKPPTEELVSYSEESRRVPGLGERSPSLSDVLSQLAPLKEEFGSIDDAPVQPEEIL